MDFKNSGETYQYTGVKVTGCWVPSLCFPRTCPSEWFQEQINKGHTWITGRICVGLQKELKLWWFKSFYKLGLFLLQVMEKSNSNWLITKRNLLVSISTGSGMTLASGITCSRHLGNVLRAQFISKSLLCPSVFWLHPETVSHSDTKMAAALSSLISLHHQILWTCEYSSFSKA